MEWDLEWGHRKRELEVIAETDPSGFIPPALLREPVLPEYLHGWMDAFYALNSARLFTVASGMTTAVRLPYPLAVSEILAAADEYGLPRRQFLTIAQTLDRAYLAHEMAKH